MPTPITPNFQRFTNTRIAWADVAALNNFFENLNFTITADNLPAASVANIGAVKSFNINQPVAPAVVVASLNIVADDGVTQNEVALKSYVDSLAAQVAYLKAWNELLYAQLVTAGIVIV